MFVRDFRAGAPRARRHAFSLVELAVVIVIVGVLAAFGVPRYRDSVERTKAAEAFNFLSAVRSAQERYMALKGQYATDSSQLDIAFEPPKYFDIDDQGGQDIALEQHPIPTGPPGWIMVLRRDGTTSSYGEYTVVFSERGFVHSSTPDHSQTSSIPDEINPIGG